MHCFGEHASFKHGAMVTLQIIFESTHYLYSYPRAYTEGQKNQMANSESSMEDLSSLRKFIYNSQNAPFCEGSQVTLLGPGFIDQVTLQLVFLVFKLFRPMQVEITLSFYCTILY